MRNYLAQPFITTAIALFFAALLMAWQPVANAAPEMKVIEAAIEQTTVIRARVNEAGIGSIVLNCGYCNEGRIRLRVDSDSRLIVDDRPVSLAGIGGSDDVNYDAFFDPKTNTLTRLIAVGGA